MLNFETSYANKLLYNKHQKVNSTKKSFIENVVNIFCPKSKFEASKKITKFFFSNLKILFVFIFKVLNIVLIDQN